jgi:hypothetical protein
MKGLDATGKPIERTLVMTFDKISLNETFPESDFELPVLPPTRPSATVKPPDLQPAVAPAAVK